MRIYKANTHKFFVMFNLTLAAIIFMPVGSHSQDANSSNQSIDDRFQIEQVGAGFVRLDKNTGETSFCRNVGDKLVCTLAIEERKALHKEIADLQNKLAALSEKNEVPAKDKELLARPKNDVPNPSRGPLQGTESESQSDQIEREMDRAFDVTKKTMRKLFKAVKELQKEFGEGGGE